MTQGAYTFTKVATGYDVVVTPAPAPQVPLVSRIVTIYGGAFHGFTDPISDEMRSVMPGVGYDALVDRLSWAQGVAFLDAALRG